MWKQVVITKFTPSEAVYDRRMLMSPMRIHVSSVLVVRGTIEIESLMFGIVKCRVFVFSK